MKRDWSNQQKRFMRMALRLGAKGLGRTSPNPAVGAVIVQEGQVVGRGYHKKAGTPHAEVNAIRDAGERASSGTLYVTLEPCNHQGRTPPCTKAILEAGIKRVVIGTLDPNPKVKGGGAEYLRSQGVEVEVGCLEMEARVLIAPFVKHTFTGMPWVRVKVASTLDGKIASRTGESKWITGEKAREFGHRLRSMSEAIMVGRGTVEADDPSLTCHMIKHGARNPLRVVLDSNLSIGLRAKIFREESKGGAVVFCRKDGNLAERASTLEGLGVRVVEVGSGPDGRLDLREVLLHLGSVGVQSILVEGGSHVHGALFDEGLVDEAFFFFAPKVMGGDGALTSVGGIGADSPGHSTRLYNVELKRLGDDILIHGYTDKGIFERCLQG